MRATSLLTALLSTIALTHAAKPDTSDAGVATSVLTSSGLSPLTSSSPTASATGCAYTEVHPKKVTDKCGIHGNLKDPDVLTTGSYSSADACAAECAQKPGGTACLSFAFASANATCTFYGKLIGAMTLEKDASGPELFNHGCFKEACKGGKSTTTKVETKTEKSKKAGRTATGLTKSTVTSVLTSSAMVMSSSSMVMTSSAVVGTSSMATSGGATSTSASATAASGSSAASMGAGVGTSCIFAALVAFGFLR